MSTIQSALVGIAYLYDNKTGIYQCTLPAERYLQLVRDLGAEDKFLYNARLPKTSEKTVRDMLRTIKEAPSSFLPSSMGSILLYQEGKLYIPNGGHRWLALSEAQSLGYDLSEVNIGISILTNLNSLNTLTRVAKQSNQSKNSVSWSLYIMDGHFNTLLQSLKQLKLLNTIYAAKPNVNGGKCPYNISAILEILHCLHMPSKILIKAYMSSGEVMKDMIGCGPTHEIFSVPSVQADLMFTDHLGQDIIESLQNFNGYLKRGAFYTRGGVKTPVKIERGALYPLLHAFKGYSAEERLYLYNETRHDLFIRMRQEIRNTIKSKKSPWDAMGRATTYWKDLRSIVTEKYQTLGGRIKLVR